MGGENINFGYLHDSSDPESKQSSDAEKGVKNVQIQKSLGLFSGISIIVGTIIGSGIWVTPGFIMTYSGSVGVYLLQWAVCGVLSAMGAICYIELACVVPLSGGETVYLKAGFGDFVSFIFSWLRAVVLGPTSCAFLAVVSAKYVLLIHPDIHQALESRGLTIEWAEKIVAVGLMVMSAGVNMASSKGAAMVQNVVTVSKLVGVAIVIVGGIVRLFQGHTDSFETGFSKLDFLKPIGPASIGLIAFNGLWNFDGWNQLNFVAEEIKDPMKNLPRSILFSMPVVVVVYVLMNVSYLTVLSPEDLFKSESVAVDWATEVLGINWSWIIPLFVSVSAFGTLHASVFASGRQVYSASREGHLPAVISYVNKHTLTPLPGLLFTAALGVIFTLLKDINQLLNMYMVAASFFYGLCMLALVVMRRTRREVRREFKVWLCIPVVIMLFFWYCTLAPLTEWEDQCPPSTPGDPCESHYSLPPGNVDMYKWNGICLLPGVILYGLRYFWRLYWQRMIGIKNKPVPGSGIFTKVVQSVLCVVDETKDD